MTKMGRHFLLDLGIGAAVLLGAAVFFLGLAAVTGPARADFILSTPDGPYIYRNTVPDANPRIIHVPPNNSDDAKERDRQWQAACDPKFRVTEYGVEYYVFKKPGCAYGRID